MKNNPKGNRVLIRAINRSTVLNTIKNLGPISRKDIAQLTGLSAATITGITAVILKEKLILEKFEGDSSGGRKPILLTINPRGGYVIGLKLSERHITAALTDLDASILQSTTTEFSSQRVENIIDCIVQSADHLISKSKIQKGKLLGIGIGLAGIVDSRNGIIRNSPIFGWKDVDLASQIHKKLGIPVFIDNDVNTLTIAEQWFGKGQGINNFLTVTIGRGVGLGIVVNGQIYHGHSGGAGEFGHIVINPEGPLCDCGKHGCLESYISDPGLIAIAKDLYISGNLAQDVNHISELLQLADNGNQVAKEIFSGAGSILGRGLADLINLFNPELIIVSGEGMRASHLIMDSMQSAINEYVMPGLRGSTNLMIDTWADDAWARGAAGLVLQDFFESPISRKEYSYSND
ncbi:MAG: ROK family transcriptional regulator [Anaerolineaceae bacterium]|nr:ROK family transcriptional regulator [Anaerolineaceae bacterium]